MNTVSLTPQELSLIKRELFNMLKLSGKQDQPDYEVLIESLDGLTFKHYSVDLYANQLIDVINEMVLLDDLAFEPQQLERYRKQLNG